MAVIKKRIGKKVPVAPRSKRVIPAPQAPVAGPPMAGPPQGPPQGPPMAKKGKTVKKKVCCGGGKIKKGKK